MRFGRLLGVRRKFSVEGVRYREVTTEPLRRALQRSRSGKGSCGKEYDVTFRDGCTMRITATPGRAYADLTGQGLLEPYKAIQQHLRPGMRLVILEGGTGAVGNWAARIVGSAGAVVSLDRDEESTTYAAHRYPLPNVSYEQGWIDALGGETDGAFDAAVAIDALGPDDPAATVIEELWRVVAGAGVLMLAAPLEPRIHLPGEPQAFTSERLATLLEQGLSSSDRPEQVSIYRRGGRTFAIARRPGEE